MIPLKKRTLGLDGLPESWHDEMMFGPVVKEVSFKDISIFSYGGQNGSLRAEPSATQEAIT